MSEKPGYFDGSGTLKNDREVTENQPLEITDEMRKNMSGNPYEV
ncbi:hypothetical protein [Thalassobacillus hwangdonensis]|uniref:Uncharacterized protein n=1 Tax=Thalassobacillus hwangdonensis TaxID=546108 RepID=A0ABW3L4I6_9BACI